MRQLSLTSPLLHGADVLAYQHLLAQRDYYKDKQDGEYGELTAQAVYRAKFWLGYRKPDHTAGALLRSYLMHDRKPSQLMRVRAAIRRKQKAQRPLGVKALAILSAHLGEKEFPPGSNRFPWATTWYGLTGPWCAMSASRAYVQAGSRSFTRGQRYAYVPYIVADARAGRNSLTVTNHPQPGDLVTYDWDRDGVADHVGLFEHWVNQSNFMAVEGNTSADSGGSQSNGGMVARRLRSRSLVQVFIHVGR